MGNSYALYSIDEASNLRKLAKFLHHMSKLEAGWKTQGSTIPCVGSYKGMLEHSFLSTWKDYEEHVKPYGFVDEQESVLKLVKDHKGKYLVYSGEEFLGTMEQERNHHDVDSEGWTYRLDQGSYYTIKNR